MEIKLDDNVLVQCPEKGFNFRMVKHCLNCEYYGGLMKATQNGEPIEGAVAKAILKYDFQVICKRPITRKLTRVEID